MNINLNTLQTYFNKYLQNQTRFSTLNNAPLISADYESDFVLSSTYNILYNFENIYNQDKNQSAIGQFTSQIKDETVKLRSKSIFENNSGFQVIECPVSAKSINVETINIRSNLVPDISSQNFIISSFTNALNTPDEREYALSNDRKTDIPYSVEFISLSNIIPKTVDTNSIIHIADIYTFLQSLASFLENLKILKYTFNYKKTYFSGRMNIQRLTNVFPDLPINPTEYAGLASYYSAILVSPFATYLNVNFSKSNASNSFDTLFSSENELQLNAISEKSLIYCKNIESDLPTFDITSKDGTNGLYSSFKIVTTKTYNLHDKIGDICDLFDLKENTIIYSKNIIQAILYIFNLWILNIQTFQIDYYACHYNCHANDIRGDNPDIESLITSYSRSIRYHIDDSDDPLFTEYIKPRLVIENQPTTYDFTPTHTIDATYTDSMAYYDRTAIDIRYPYYAGTLENPVTLSSYIIVSNMIGGKEGTPIIKIPEEVSFTNETTFTLNIDIMYCHDATINDTELSANPTTHRRYLSAVGDLDVHFVHCTHSGIKDVSLENAHLYFTDKDGNATIDGITYDWNQISGTYKYPNAVKPLSCGYVYFDKSTNGMNSKISIRDRNLTGLSSYKNTYSPYVIAAVKHTSLDKEMIISADQLAFEFINNDGDPDATGNPTVIVTGKPSSRYSGMKTCEYTIYPLPKTDLMGQYESHNAISVEYSALEDPLYYDGSLITYSSIVIYEYNTETEGYTSIPNSMFDFNYTGNNGPGIAVLTITPSKYYGESYYTGNITKRFTIQSKETNPTINTDWKSIPIGSFSIDENDGKKFDGLQQYNSLATRAKYLFTKPPKWQVFLAGVRYKCYVEYNVEREKGDDHWVQGLISIKVDNTVVGMDMYAGTIRRETKKHAGQPIEGSIYFDIGPYTYSPDIVIGMMAVGHNREVWRTLTFTLNYYAESASPSGSLIVDSTMITMVDHATIPAVVWSDVQLSAINNFVADYNDAQLFPYYATDDHKIHFKTDDYEQTFGDDTYTVKFSISPSYLTLDAYENDINLKTANGNSNIVITAASKTVKQKVYVYLSQIIIGIPSSTYNTKTNLNSHKTTYTCTYDSGTHAWSPPSTFPGEDYTTLINSIEDFLASKSQEKPSANVPFGSFSDQTVEFSYNTTTGEGESAVTVTTTGEIKYSFSFSPNKIAKNYASRTLAVTATATVKTLVKNS